MAVPNREDRKAQIAMLFFLATEAMFFAGLISAYWVLRAQAGAWPPPDQPRLPVLITGINTLVLLASGVLLFQGRRALRAGCNLCLVGWIGTAGLLGAVFLAVQGYEWARLIGFGLTTAKNIYGGLFYVIVGTHGAHVFAALIVLLIVFLKAVQGRYTAANPTGYTLGLMFWSFVTFLWPVLYAIVYLT